MNRFHWHVLFLKKILSSYSRLTKFLHVHIAKCNIEIDTYLSKKKLKISMIYKMCVKRYAMQFMRVHLNIYCVLF